MSCTAEASSYSYKSVHLCLIFPISILFPHSSKPIDFQERSAK